MKTTLMLFLAVLLAAPSASAAPPERCAGPNAVDALARLTSTPAVRVERAADRVALIERRTGDTLLRATCDSVVVPLPVTLRRPQRGTPARVAIVRDAAGAPLLTRGVTARGAVSLDIAVSALAKAGLRVLAFDNDDVHVSDAEGAVLFAVATAPDGTLTRRDATRTTVVHPDGTVERR